MIIWYRTVCANSWPGFADVWIGDDETGHSERVAITVRCGKDLLWEAAQTEHRCAHCGLPATRQINEGEPVQVMGL